MKKKPHLNKKDQTKKDQEKEIKQAKQEFQEWYAEQVELSPFAVVHLSEMLKKKKIKNIGRAISSLETSVSVFKIFLSEGKAEMSEEEILSGDLKNLQRNLGFAFQFIQADLVIKQRRENETQKGIEVLKQKRLEEQLKKEAADARRKELEAAVAKLTVKNPYWKPGMYHSSDFYYLNDDLRPSSLKIAA